MQVFFVAKYFIKRATIFVLLFTPTQRAAKLPLFQSRQAIDRACFYQNYHDLSAY